MNVEQFAGPVGELLLYTFQPQTSSRTHKAHDKNRSIAISITSSKRPSARAQRACECPGAHAKSCWVVAIYALASLALVAASSSFALLQEPFAKESLEGAKSFPSSSRLTMRSLNSKRPSARAQRACECPAHAC